MSEPSTTVVVGIDGSGHAQSALRWAIREAELRGATLELVHAWQVPAALLGVDAPTMVPVFYPGQLQKWASQLALAAAAEARAAAPDLDIRVSVVQAHPAAALLRAADHAQMLVIGTRGLGGFEGMLVGSITQHCVRHAPCPVVAVPGPAQQPCTGPPRGKSDASCDGSL